MKLFNSLSRTVEPFTPTTTGKAGIYSCGPTVYNNLHIGNLSAFIYADVLRRTLSACGLEPRHVMNITDVDDKTIRDSKDAYPAADPMTALKQLTDKYAAVFLHDMELVGNDTEAVEFVSAVASIPSMIELVQKIADNGFAYAADDGIYFSIANYTAAGHTYGRLQSINVSTAKSRVSHDEYDKDNASDFALWKAAGAGEPAWDASFTFDGRTLAMPGRPGWHIECSAMSQTLGVPFDIHTGGIDLKFPHHENEIAQSVAAGAMDLANYFVHNNHILVEGRKMSKSLGNVTTLRDVEEKGFSPLAFRLVVLESHYQSESNFSWDIMEAAANRLKRWQMTADLVWQHNLFDLSELDIGAMKHAVLESMAANLDTPKTLALIDVHMADIAASEINDTNREDIMGYFTYIENLLGIRVLGTDVSDELRELLKQRDQARSQKQWDESDRLRDEVEKHGFGVKDTSRGQQWYRLV